jgi:hypothetical protein
MSLCNFTTNTGWINNNWLHLENFTFEPIEENSFNFYQQPEINNKNIYSVLNDVLQGNNLAVNKVKEQTGKILNENDLSNIKTGDWVFFSHVNEATHLAIAFFQKILNLGNIYNLTHVGLVTKVISKDNFEVTEIPEYGQPLKQNLYNIQNLFDDEELFFAPPPSIDKAGHLVEIMQKVGGTWVSPLDDVSNHYNFPGLIKLPFTEDSFTEEDKKSFITALVDYIFFNSQPQLEKKRELKDKPYFCSEFTQEVTQFSKILQTFPSISKTLKKEVKKIGLDFKDIDGRKQIINYLKGRFENVKLWDDLLKDPLFSIPPRKATPGNLLDLALRHSSAIRIRNDIAKPRFVESELSEESYPQYVEYLSTRLLNRYLEGEIISATDKDVEKLLNFLENKMHYSRETLNCFVQTCHQADYFLECMHDCLDETLTWQEKLTIYFISREINRSVEQILNHPLLLEFLQNPSDPKWKDPDLVNLLEVNVEKILDLVFPIDIHAPLKSSENLFAKHFIKRVDKATLIKYIPLSLAYAPPSQEIKNFLNNEKIPSEKLAEHAFYLFSLFQTKKSSGSIDQMHSFSKLVLKNGLAQIDQPWVGRVLNKISKETGYTTNTLKCTLNSLPEAGNLNNKVEKCLSDTLSVSEKINVYLSNQMIVLATENLIKNNDFKEFIHNGKFVKNLDDAHLGSEDKLLNVFFPIDPSLSYTESIKNYASRSLCSQLLKQGLSQFIFKDIFLGLSYDTESFSPQIKDFLVKENISQMELIEQMYKFLKILEA